MPALPLLQADYKVRFVQILVSLSSIAAAACRRQMPPSSYAALANMARQFIKTGGNFSRRYFCLPLHALPLLLIDARLPRHCCWRATNIDEHDEALLAAHKRCASLLQHISYAGEPTLFDISRGLAARYSLLIDISLPAFILISCAQATSSCSSALNTPRECARLIMQPLLSAPSCQRADDLCYNAMMRLRERAITFSHDAAIRDDRAIRASANISARFRH